ncbi:MAG: hypothetical protein AB7F32_12065 [Victivallaceae bacterium]
MPFTTEPAPVRRDKPNVLVLDHFDYEPDGVPAGKASTSSPPMMRCANTSGALRPLRPAGA